MLHILRCHFMKIPENTEVSVQEGMVTVKGKSGSLEKKFNPRVLKVTAEGGEVTVTALSKKTRRVSAMIGALESHLKNMFKGACENYEKKLSLVYAHFPVAVEVKGTQIQIKNFLGEKTPRFAKIQGSVKVAVKGAEITVTGNDIEDVGQTASNIIKATRITKRDIRVFQDGIYYA